MPYPKTATGDVEVASGIIVCPPVINDYTEQRCAIEFIARGIPYQLSFPFAREYLKK